MKITIIELLNRMANDKAPRVVKYNGYFYNYDNKIRDYKYMIEEGKEIYLFEFGVYTRSLNDEVEVIEEAPKTLEKLEITNADNSKLHY